MVKKAVKKSLCFILTTVMLISSFGFSGTKVMAASSFKTDGWCIQLYMCGSNLESDDGAGSKDILELMKAQNVPSNVKVVIETGGSKEWHFKDMIEEYYKNVLGMSDETIAKIQTKNIDANHIQRYKIKFDNMISQDGKMIQYPSLVQLSANEGTENPDIAKEENVTPTNMGKQESLQDFVTDVAGDYNHNVLILWNHGGGPAAGVCYDDWSENGNDCLTLCEIDAALAASKHVIPNEKYDMVGFDACLMSSFESLAVLSRYASYATASMTLEGNDGWDYTPMMDCLVDHLSTGTTLTGGDLGKAEVDAYGKFYFNKDGDTYDQDACLTTFDLSNMDVLIRDFDAMAKAMVHISADDNLLAKFQSAAYTATEIDTATEMVGMKSFLTKTMDFAKNYIKNNKNASLQTVLNNVENCQEYLDAATAFSNALFTDSVYLNMICCEKTSKYYGEKGLALYFPQRDSGDAKCAFPKWDYDQLGISTYYASFAYHIVHDVVAKQYQRVSSQVYYNGKTSKYHIQVKNRNYIDFAGERIYLTTGNKTYHVRTCEADLNEKGQADIAAITSYVTLNKAPIYMSSKDHYYGDYYTFASVNGEEQILYFYIENGIIYNENSFEVGDKIVPYVITKDGDTVPYNKGTFTVKKSDIDEEGNVSLPYKKQKALKSQLTYDICARGLSGEYDHNYVNPSKVESFLKAKVNLSSTVFFATGKTICPKVTVSLNGKVLKENKDYTLVYQNNLAAGKATVTIYGKGNYLHAQPFVKHYTIKVND